VTWVPSRPDDAEPRRIGESLGRVARSLSVPDPRVLSSVFTKWEEVVGPAVAAHTRPLKLAGDVLLVAVDEPAWATQLRFLEAEVLARLAADAGVAVAARLEIQVRSGPGAGRGRRPRRKRSGEPE
jgi:predicted nucleic acid-binding Zn ribbon protein